MARFYKIDSPIHQHFESLFALMKENGISVNTYGYNRFILDGVRKENSVVEIVDSESGEIVSSFPPICEFRVRIFDS